MLHLGAEEGIHAGGSHNIGGRGARIGIGGTHLHIVDVGAHAQRRIGRKRPGRGGPGQEIKVFLPFHPELHGGGGVAHIFITAGLVELMGTQARSIRGRIRLNGISLVKKALVVNLFEEVPEGFNVAVVVGDIRVVHIYPISYALGHVHPFLGVFHHLLAAGGVVLLYGYFGADIGLGDAQFLLHTQLYGEAVGVPASAAGHLVTRLRLVSADSVLDGTGHHVVDAGHAVGAGRTFKENKLRGTFTQLHRALESTLRFPPLQDFVPTFCQIQPLVFFECHIFCLFLYTIISLQR